MYVHSIFFPISILTPFPKSNDIQLSKELWFLTYVIMFQTHFASTFSIDRVSLVIPASSSLSFDSHHVHFIYTCTFCPYIDSGMLNRLLQPNGVAMHELAHLHYRITTNNTHWNDMEDDDAIDTRIFWYLNSAFCDVQHVIAFNDANHSHDLDVQICVCFYLSWRFAASCRIEFFDVCLLFIE